MTWDSNRRDARWEFEAVEWPSLESAGMIGCFTGGSIELSALDDLRATGTLDYAGEEPKAPMVRVSYAFRDDEGNEHRREVATMLADLDSATLSQGRASGSVKCESVLSVLQSRLAGTPVTYEAGTSAVAKAKEVAESLGATVSASDSSYRLSSALAFEAGKSYLDIVNGLLDVAGFAAARPDSHGRVVMEEYVEPLSRTPMWLFSADGSVMLPEPEVSLDRGCNAVRLLHSTEDETLWARAANVDEASPASIPSRMGIESTAFESVSELEGDTASARLANLKEEARRKLVDKSTAVEHVRFSCPLLPFEAGDALEIDYPSIGLSWKGTASSVSVTLDAAGMCEVDARRFVRPDFKVEVTGGSL